MKRKLFFISYAIAIVLLLGMSALFAIHEWIFFGFFCAAVGLSNALNLVAIIEDNPKEEPNTDNKIYVSRRRAYFKMHKDEKEIIHDSVKENFNN